MKVFPLILVAAVVGFGLGLYVSTIVYAVKGHDENGEKNERN